jgi:hypothetical protein
MELLMSPLRGSNTWGIVALQGLTPLARPCRPYGAEDRTSPLFEQPRCGRINTGTQVSPRAVDSGNAARSSGGPHGSDRRR